MKDGQQPVTRERRAVYLGLRSSTQYFASKQGFVKLEARLKALALLYDHLVLERGVYDCLVGPGGSFSMVIPSQGPEDLKPVRTSKRNFRVSAGLSGGNQRDLVINSPTEKHFRAQFESVIQQLAPVHPNWVTPVYFGTAEVITRAAEDTANKWMWEDANVLTDFMPDASSSLRDIVPKSVYVDLARSFHFGIDIAPDGSHSPLVTRVAMSHTNGDAATGERALRLWIPDVRVATWQDIDYLRKDPGIANLRAKLRELDVTVASDEELLRHANEDYQDYMERHRPRWPKFVAALNWSLVSFTPLAPIGAVAQPIVEANAVRKDRRHWTASFMRVRRYIDDRMEKQA